MSVTGTTWVLSSLDGDRVDGTGKAPATLTFDRSGQLVGTLACNTIGGGTAWTANGRLVRTGRPDVSTRMGCMGMDELLKVGLSFWNQMATSTHWRRTGGRLTILFADGRSATLVPRARGARATHR